MLLPPLQNLKSWIIIVWIKIQIKSIHHSCRYCSEVSIGIQVLPLSLFFLNLSVEETSLSCRILHHLDFTCIPMSFNYALLPLNFLSVGNYIERLNHTQVEFFFFFKNTSGTSCWVIAPGCQPSLFIIGWIY